MKSNRSLSSCDPPYSLEANLELGKNKNVTLQGPSVAVLQRKRFKDQQLIKIIN